MVGKQKQELVDILDLGKDFIPLESYTNYIYKLDSNLAARSSLVRYGAFSHGFYYVDLQSPLQYNELKDNMKILFHSDYMSLYGTVRELDKYYYDNASDTVISYVKSGKYTAYRMTKLFDYDPFLE